MPVPEGYVEVSERIQRFYESYPEGSLVEWRQPRMMHIGERSFICYSAAAFPSLLSGQLSSTFSLPQIALGYGGLALLTTLFTIAAARNPTSERTSR